MKNVVRNECYAGQQFEIYHRLNQRYESCNFYSSDLTSAIFDGIFKQCSFQRAILRSSGFKGATFIECDFSGVAFNDVSFQDSQFIRCDFSNASFYGASGMFTCHFSFDCAGVESIQGAKVVPFKSKNTWKIYANLTNTDKNTPVQIVKEHGVWVGKRDKGPAKVVDIRTAKKKKSSNGNLIEKLPEVEHYRSPPPIKPGKSKSARDTTVDKQIAEQKLACGYAEWEIYPTARVADDEEACYLYGAPDYARHYFDPDRWGYGKTAILECSDINVFKKSRARALQRN